MRSRSSTAPPLLAVAAAIWFGLANGAAAQPPQQQHEIPQSQVLEHQENLERLQALGRRPGQVGAVARRAIVLFRQHNAREQAYILPPLTLLPELADGKVGPDMEWALAMADRVKADRELIFEEHTKIIAVLNDLQLAGQRAHDREAVEFARSAATDTLNDVELMEPTVILIGDYLRARLHPGP
jgi:hypothetical protein